MHCNSFFSLLDSGGTSVFDSGEGVTNVDGEVAELDQRKGVSEVGCGMRHGEVAFYKVIVGSGRSRVTIVAMASWATGGVGDGMAMLGKARGAS